MLVESIHNLLGRSIGSGPDIMLNALLDVLLGEGFTDEVLDRTLEDLRSVENVGSVRHLQLLWPV